MLSHAANKNPGFMRHRVLVMALLIAPAALGGQSHTMTELSETGSIELARAHNQLLLAGSARRAAITARARQEAAPVNLTFEWRSENLATPLALDRCARRAGSSGSRTTCRREFCRGRSNRGS